MAMAVPDPDPVVPPACTCGRCCHHGHDHGHWHALLWAVLLTTLAIAISALVLAAVNVGGGRCWHHDGGYGGGRAYPVQVQPYSGNGYGYATPGAVSPGVVTPTPTPLQGRSGSATGSATGASTGAASGAPASAPTSTFAQ